MTGKGIRSGWIYDLYPILFMVLRFRKMHCLMIVALVIALISETKYYL